MVDDGERLRPEACQSPVWDTALAAAGAACLRRVRRPPAARPRRRVPPRAGSARQGRLGDPQARTSRPAAGPSSTRTTTTPTSTTRPSSPLALHGMGIGEEDAIARGVDWLVGMQSRGGGWGAFDVDNDAMWLYKIPFCDFGKVTDEPTADVTAHSLEALGALGVHRDAAERGVEWLLVGAGGGRLVVRPLGRQPHLRHRRRATRARGLRHPARPPLDAPRRRLARLRPAGERRLRRGHPLLRRSCVAWPGRVHDGVADGLGAPCLRGRRKR